MDLACSPAQQDKFQRTSQRQGQTRNPEIGQLCTCNRIPFDELATQKRCYLRETHRCFIHSEAHRLDLACSPAHLANSQRTSQRQEQTRHPEIGQLCTGNRIPLEEQATQKERSLTVMGNIFIQSEAHRLDLACSPAHLGNSQRTSRRQGQTRNPEIGQLCTSNHIPLDELATQKRCYLRETHRCFTHSEAHRLDLACSPAHLGNSQRTSQLQEQTRNPEIG